MFALLLRSILLLWWVCLAEPSVPPVFARPSSPSTTSSGTASGLVDALGRRARRLLTIQLNAVWGHRYGRGTPAAKLWRRGLDRVRPRFRSRRRVGGGFLTMVFKRLCGYVGVRIGEASNPGPGAGAADSLASSSGTVDSPSKRTRRRLEYVDYDEASFSGDSLALHESSAKVLRSAARQWAQNKGLVVGTFSSPSMTPTDHWQCTCLCHKHERCHAAQGTCYTFVGILERSVYRLSIQKAGTCGDDLRKSRAGATKLYKDDQPTVAERQQVLGAMKELLSTQRKATPGAVVKRLEAKGTSVAAVRVKAILRARRMAEGPGLLEFVESQETFEEFIKTVPASDMSFCHLQRQSFQWVATLTGFLDALQALMPENAESAKIFITADFTFRLTVMNHSYGIISTLFAESCVSRFCWGKVAGNEGSFFTQTQVYVCFADSSPPTP